MGMINGLALIKGMFSMDIKVIITICLPQSSCTVMNTECPYKGRKVIALQCPVK